MLLALFGQPIGKSLSPAIHRQFADQFGLQIEYRRIETGASGFAGELQAFLDAGGIGCNVTLPLKQQAWRLAACATQRVEQAGAANTLLYEPGTGWLAHNTDGPGLMSDLVVNNRVVIAGKRVLILGAGGAVAGILADLVAADPAEIVIVNRNQQRAGSLASRFNEAGIIAVSAWHELVKQGCFDLVINATSLGHHGEAPRLSGELFAAGSVCYDLNYHVASGPLKRLCEDLRQRYIDGLGMLVEQAASSFLIWTGKQPVTREVIDVCRAGLTEAE